MLYPYVALHDKYMIRHLTYFPFFRVALWLLVYVASSWDMMTFDKKMQDPLFLAPVLTNKVFGRKFVASAKCQTGTIEKRRIAPQSLRNSARPFSSVAHYKPVTGEKNHYPCTVVLYCTELYCTALHGTVLYYYCTVLYYSTVLLYLVLL